MASSGGRVLYRECGPSQDRNPVPGDLPFCFVFFFFFFVISFSIYFFEASLLFIFYTSLKRSVEYLCIVLFSLYYIGQGFLPLVGKFTLSKCTLKLRTCIETLLNLSIIISNNQVFLLMLLQSQNTQFFTQSLCTCSWQYVFHLLHIIFKFSMHSKFPAAQWIEYCTANTVRIRIDILYQWTCRFAFFLLFRLLFYETSLLFLFYTSLKRSLERLCILLIMLYYINQGFLSLIGKFTLSKCTLKLRTCAGTLLNLSVIIIVHLFPAVRTPLVTYNL